MNKRKVTETLTTASTPVQQNIVDSSLYDATVTSSNALIRAYYTKIDSVFFLRLFTSVTSQIRPDDRDFASYTVPFTSIFSKKEHGGNTYKLINKMTDQALNIIIKIPESKNRLVKYPLFSKCVLDSQKNVIEIGIHPDLKPHLLNLKNHFTQYQLSDFQRLSSVYSQRLFQLLSSWRGSQYWRVDIEQLHNMLDSSPSMRKDFKQFRVYALEQAQKELLREASFYFRYELEKQGRKVKSIVFFFEPEDEATIQENAKQEISDLQKKSNKCFEKHLKKHEKCIPKNKSKICTYCLGRGRKSVDQFRLWDEPNE